MLKFFISLGIALVSLLGLFAAGLGLVFATTPQPKNIKDCLTTEMYRVRLCPKEGGYVRLGGISRYVKMSVIASEDAGFYGHNGLDFHELKMSFEKNWEKGRFARGGSTITQQLAKNVYLSSEKSLLRKAREAIIALQIEDLLTKDEILERYLNVVEFGPNLYGVGKAARFYFGKTAGDLDVVEGAWLAFLLPNPKKYSSSFRSKKLTPFAQRQLRTIVNKLLFFKKIDAEEHARAIAAIPYLFTGQTPPAVEVPLDPELDQALEEDSGEDVEPSSEESGGEDLL